MNPLPKYICYNKKYNRYYFTRRIYGNNYTRSFRCLLKALNFLDAFNYYLEFDRDNIELLFK